MADMSLQEMTGDTDDLFSMVIVDLIPDIAKELVNSGHIELEPQVKLVQILLISRTKNST
jgi:hypothetical protein